MRGRTEAVNMRARKERQIVRPKWRILGVGRASDAVDNIMLTAFVLPVTFSPTRQNFDPNGMNESEKH